MKIKKQRHGLKVGIGCLVLLLAGGAAMYGVLYGSGTSAEPQQTAFFSFDAAAAPGWYQSKLDTSTREGRRSLLLFDRDMSSPTKESNLESCHVSAFMNVGYVDIQGKLAAITNSPDAGYEIVSLGVQPLSLQLPSGIRTYELHTFNMIAPAGASPIKAGNSFGYVQTGDYYVEVQAVCDTPEQLESTLPALQAIRFDDTLPAN